MADKNFIVKNGLTVGGVDIVNSSGALTQSLITAVPSGAAASTQSVGNSSTAIATTAYVRGEIDALIDSAPGTLNTLNELAAAINDDAAFNTTLTNAVALKAPLASPTFTGIPVLSNRLKTLDGSAQLNIGQWDGTNHRIEADANRPLVITAYHSTGILLGTSGNTKLQVNGSGIAVTGTVGIGTSNIDNNAKLHIEDSAYPIINLDRSSLSADGNHLGYINFQNNGDIYGYIGAWVEDLSETDGELRFATQKGTSLTDKMVITSDGNVGIGTNAPTHALHVLTTGNKGFFLDRNAGNNAANLNEFSTHYSLSIKTRASGSNLNFGGNSSGTWLQGTDGAGSAGAKVINLNPFGGAVGIGTTSPSHQLDVRSSSTSADNFLTIGNSDNTKFLGLYGGHSGNALPTIYADSTSTALRFAFADDTAFNGFSEKMRIDASGNVGIGTTDFPSGMASSSYKQLKIGGTTLSSSGSGNGSAFFINQNAYIGASNDHKFDSGHKASSIGMGSGDINFYTHDGGGASADATWAKATRMHITETGNVGIGTTDPTARLHLCGVAANGEHMVISGLSNPNRGLSISTQKSNYPTDSGQNDAVVVYNAQDTESSALYPGHVFQYGGNEALRIQRIESSGNTAAVGIGGINPSYTLDVNTNGESNAMRIEQGTNTKDLSVFWKNNGTGTGDDTLLQMYTAAGAGDPKVRFAISGNETYEMGIDNSNSDKLKISNGTSLGTSDLVVFHPGGEVSIANAVTIGSGAKTYLAVGDGSGNATLSMYTGSDNYAYINFADGVSGASADPGYIRYSHVHDSFYANRSFTAPNISSDEAMKENITDITDGWNIIKDLRPRKFDWKKDPLGDVYLPGMGQNASGFIAQEVETVLPGEVHSHDGGMKGLSQIGIVAYLVKTVQELEARIKTLEG